MVTGAALVLIRLACACGVIIVAGFIIRGFRLGAAPDLNGVKFVLPHVVGAAFVIAVWAMAAAVMVF